jgi:3-mercaptopyruvate sulfurtransferase SseA
LGRTDCREPAELSESGWVPSAINIPIKSNPASFFLPPEEFEDALGFQKPSTDTELVFYCKAGVRAIAAARLAWQGGYKKVGSYNGSWADWEAKGGKIAR